MAARTLCLSAALAALALLPAAARPMDLAGAHPYGSGFVRAGEELVCVATNAPATRTPSAGASWYVALNQKEPRPVRFGAEGSVEALDDFAAALVYVDVTFADGSHQWGVTARFDPLPGTGWHRRDVLIRPRLAIRSITGYLFVRGGMGKVRFRRPMVETLQPDPRPLLDGCPTDVAVLPAAEGFLIRDAAADGTWQPLAVGTAACGCTLTATAEPRAAGRVVDAVLTAGGEKDDRAMTLVYMLRLPPGPLVWFDSPRTSVPLTSTSEERTYVLNWMAGHGLSAWPFGAVAAADQGWAIGIDPDFPAVYRVTAAPRFGALFIAFDLGFAPEHPSAHVRFTVFPFAAADGFRGALESYQALHPEAYRVRAPRQGAWMAFHSISNLPHHEDFGFRFKEGTKERDWDDAHGIYTFHYEEPCTWWMPLGKSGTGAARTTRAACAARVEEMAAKGDSAARAWKSCAVMDAAGRSFGRIQDTPWCNGIVWALNCTPGLAGAVTEYGRKWSEEKLVARYGATPPPFPQGLDGEYLDSAGFPLTCSFDFDRAHFAALRAPLSFTPGPAPKVGVFKHLMGAECVIALARSVHGRGRLMMANSTPVDNCLLTFHLDVMGIEANWRRTGAWSPPSDAELIYRRAVCGAKPYCFLQNTDFTRFSAADTERYMQRCLAYGMFPSFFSANAATGHYFSQPTLYERDRPLFRRYLPLITQVAEAGWRPVNRLLKVSGTSVFTEQFGAHFATVFNLSPKPQRVRLTPLQGAAIADERVTGGVWTLPAEGLEVELLPETCRLLSFRACRPTASHSLKERQPLP